MNYTLGPWEIDDNYIISPIKVSGCRIGGSFQNDIASVFPTPGNEDEQKANLNLIAAAPEMYEILNRLLSFLENIEEILPSDKRKITKELIENVKAVTDKVDLSNKVQKGR